MSRLAFIIGDLERAIRDAAPNGPAPEIVLSPGTFQPVVEELASHFGAPVPDGATEYAVGRVLIRRGK